MTDQKCDKFISNASSSSNAKKTSSYDIFPWVISLFELYLRSLLVMQAYLRSLHKFLVKSTFASLVESIIAS